MANARHAKRRIELSVSEIAARLVGRLMSIAPTVAGAA
jgi:hypothetical protein